MSTRILHGLALVLSLGACGSDPDADTAAGPGLEDLASPESSASGLSVYRLSDATTSDAVGYMYASGSASSMASTCSGLTTLAATADGTDEICVDSAHSAMVTGGAWEGLQMQFLPYGMAPHALEAADLTSRGCETAPTSLVSWFTLENIYAACYSSYSCDSDLYGGLDAMLNTGVAQIADGQVMRGASFDGSTTGYAVTMGDENLLDVGTGNFSVAMWLRMDASDATSAARSLVDKRDSTTGAGYQVFLYNRRMGIQLATSTSAYTNYIAGSSVAIPADGAWHQFVVTVERASTHGVRFYVDGVKKADFDATTRSGSLNSSNQVRIGRGWWSGSSSFAGDLDEVQFYSASLSGPSEVIPLYQAGVYGLCR